MDYTAPNVDVHRIVMCQRMCRSLELGEIFLDLTSHKTKWSIRKNDEVRNTFHSLDEMEDYMEELMSRRFSIANLGNMSFPLKLRMNTIHARAKAEKTGLPVTFASRSNFKNRYYAKKAVL